MAYFYTACTVGVTNFGGEFLTSFEFYVVTPVLMRFWRYI